MHLKHNRSKGIAINKVPIKKASELFGILNMVFFSPEDLNIIKMVRRSAADFWILNYASWIKYICQILQLTIKF